MTDRTWLLAYAVGPVQDFVATARKMRDLWAGSELLSQLAAAARRAAWTRGAEGVFPAVGPTGPVVQAAAALPNRGVVVWVGGDPAALARSMEQAVQGRLYRVARTVERVFCKGTVGQSAFDADRFRQQLSDLIEFYSAWVPCDDVADPTKYRAAYASLQREMIARKRTRWFAPAAYGGAGVAKSALDAARESVLRNDYVRAKEGSNAARHQRRFSIEGEALDAPGLIKRVIGGERPFQAISRIALGPWLQAVLRDARGQTLIEDLTLACGSDALSEAGLVSRSAPRGLLSFDGQLLFEGRITLEANRQIPARAGVALGALGDALQSCEAVAKIPAPYIALLALDIDHFGTRLWQSDLAGQQALARLAAGFAADVQQMVDKHLGVVLYAGGDEALVVLPVSTALGCAVAIQDCFSQRVTRSNLVGDLPTLSAGLAIGHMLTPLSRLRHWVLDALDAAKHGFTPYDRPRNALVVTAKPRSGGVLRARGGWDTPAANPLSALGHRLGRWMDAYRSGALPAGAPYEVARLLQAGAGDPRLQLAHLTRFAGRRPGGPDTQWVVDARACLQRRPRSGALLEAEDLVQELLLARWMDRNARAPAAAPAPTARQAAIEAADAVERS